MADGDHLITIRVVAVVVTCVSVEVKLTTSSAVTIEAACVCCSAFIALKHVVATAIHSVAL